MRQPITYNQVGSFAVGNRLLDPDPARNPTSRCSNCFACDNCFGVCPDNAVVKLDDPGPYRYEIQLDFCKGCGLCAEECPCGANEMEPEAI